MSAARPRAWSWLATAAILVLAAFLRGSALDDRPMHHDEAVNAATAAQLWNGDGYRYDPVEFHGPSLAYLAQPALWLSAASRFAETRETDYRGVTAVFGFALVAFTLAIAPGIGRAAALWAGLFCALSPAMVFYSRYFIHEMLLVVFSFAAIISGWRWFRARGKARWLWALSTGASLGMMHATKETFVIAAASMCVGIVAAATGTRSREGPSATWGSVSPRHVAAAIGAAIAVSTLLFSSFFSHPQGVVDSIAAFLGYLDRGTFAESPHHKPWWWYGSLLLYHDPDGGPVFSEAVIVLLALAGGVAAARGRGIDRHCVPLARFLAAYTLAMFATYSLISYKTPWCLIGFLHGMILLAGIGAAALFRAAAQTRGRVTVALVLVAVLAQLAHQTTLVNFRFSSDDRNPYVYAHSLPDVKRMATLVGRIAESPGNATPPRTRVMTWRDDAAVVFYLREVPNVSWGPVGPLPTPPPAELILAPLAMREELDLQLKADHRTEFFQLRPGVWGALYIRRDLWDALPR